ncbi:MAG: hypothetical protein J6N15_04595 [Ruminiclostridium sp.]|nr:hypothetical protein [Ruminiclostridium sp.]
MKKTIIPLNSYTSAQRAVRVLARHGIKARVVKTGTSKYGCSFGISVSEPPDMVCGILADAGIRCEGAMPFPPPPPPPPWGAPPARPPRPPRSGR